MSKASFDRFDGRCVLCGKSREQVKKLILGVHGGVCLDCVDLCNDIIRSDTSRPDAPETPQESSVNVLSLLADLIELSRYLGDPWRDLAILGEGNTSARIDKATFVVKASGQKLATIAEAGFCAVQFSKVLPAFDAPDLTDADVKRILSECKAEGDPTVMPSVETFLHAYLLTLPNINFVGHTHPTYVNAILCSVKAREALAGRLFPDEIVCCGPAPCFVEYTDPGIVLARTLKQRVEEYHAEYGEWPKVILMQNHGFIAIGKTPKDIKTITDMYVKTARILIGTYALGGPNFMTPEHVARIHTRPDEHYRQQQIKDN